MRNTRKISIAIVLVMLLTMTLAVIPSSAAETKTLYFNPGGSSLWDQAGAWFDAWTWGGSTADAWITFTDANNDGIYEAEIPSDRTGIKIYRRGSSHTGQDWNGNQWNNSGDVTIPADKNMYTITGWNAGDGSWSTHTPPAPSCTEHSYDQWGVCTNDGCDVGTFYTITGNDATVFGSVWSPENGKKMTYNPETKVYTLVIEDVAANDYQFKAIPNGNTSWAGAIGGNTAENSSAEGNFIFSVEVDGSTVTITLDGRTLAASVVPPESTDEPGTDEPGTDEPGTDEPGTDVPGSDDPIDIPTVETITVYFENNWLWTDVRGYYWIGEGDNKVENETWPGVALTVVGTLDGHDVYAITIPANVAGLVISGIKNDESGNRDQTPDITEMVDGAGWKMLYVDGEGNKLETITFDPNQTPGTDEPGTDEPGTDVPGTDEPGTDEPGTDVPGTDEPGTDEPGTDVPGSDDPIDIPTVETITVYFENNWLWTDVRGYYWIGEGDNKVENETWPGVALTVVGTLDGHDVYAITIPANVAGLVISGIKNDESGNRDQTPDITEMVDGAGWKMLYVDGEGNKLETITFDPNQTPGTDEPGTDEPGTDVPGTDEPGTDEPGTDEPGTDVPGTDEPTTGPDYYLIGYINGANYGCESDWENLGEYKFVNGKLTATFTADTYVFVKTGDNQNWYMTDGWLGTEVNSAVLGTTYGENSNKLHVPAGVEVTFTLVDNGDGTLTLSFVTAGGTDTPGTDEPGTDTPTETPTFTVAGTGAHLGTEWDTTNTANDMTYADGVYYIIYTNVKAGEYEFKCAKDHAWTVAFPAENYKYTVEADGSTVTITLDGENVTVDVEAPEAPKPDDNKPGTGDNKPEDNKPGTDDNKPNTDNNNNNNNNNQPEQPEEELGFFEAIWKAIVDFFASIGNFFANLFSGAKK